VQQASQEVSDFHYTYVILSWILATVPSCPSLIYDIITCNNFFSFYSFLCKLYSFSFPYYIVISGIYPISPSHHDSTSFLLLFHLLTFIPTLHQSLFLSLDFFASLLALMSLFHSLSLFLSPHFCAFTQTFLYSVLLFHFIPSLLLFFLSTVTLFIYSIFSMSYGPIFYPSSLIFHTVHVLHCK
jgi:hypothetical protein